MEIDAYYFPDLDKYTEKEQGKTLGLYCYISITISTSRLVLGNFNRWSLFRSGS